ncbi:unnamed protein product [Echinostoma caproni]|uniref:Uncharacterized protein n=1 Tax=Echinostoma caproni TaxID=27848 RepID=A0A3P8DHC6_9TREM|nr:unnamed protein product [Echinostoma caproni]
MPYLNTLILTSNGFSELRELDPLATCDKLSFLTLTHCPVTMRANYRLYVISLLPAVSQSPYLLFCYTTRSFFRFPVFYPG